MNMSQVPNKKISSDLFDLGDLRSEIKNETPAPFNHPQKPLDLNNLF